MTLGTFWSCFSTSEEPSSQTAYQDILGRKYVYDSTVPNCKNVIDGDVVVIRDSEFVYGFGWVQSVHAEPRVKRMTLCPSCNRSGPTHRTTLSPTFRCNRCRAEFDDPVYEDRPLTSYEAEYGATWAPFPEPLPRDRLDDLYAGADRQNAIRRLDRDRALAFLMSTGSVYGTVELREAGGNLTVGRRAPRSADTPLRRASAASASRPFEHCCGSASAIVVPSPGHSRPRSWTPRTSISSLARRHTTSTVACCCDPTSTDCSTPTG